MISELDIKYSLLSVTYVNHMGSDKTVADAARVSYDRADFDNSDLSDKDRKLISFLAKHKHTTPFEHLTLSVVIKCPMFVRSQIMRHRTFSFNEVSRRYTSENLEFFEFESLRQQAKKNLQCSADSEVEHQLDLKNLMHAHRLDSLRLYNQLLDEGVAREQARSVLPQCLMTSFVMTGNALNWSRFLKLRLNEHAQKECRSIAQGCLQHLKDTFPHTVSTFEEHGWLSLE